MKISRNRVIYIAFAAIFAAGLLFVAMLSFSNAATDTSAAAAEAKWGTDYKASLAQAKREGKFVLADFSGSDWCGWCKKLDKEVFSKKQFVKWAGENVVLLVVDFPRATPQDATVAAQNKELLEKYKVTGFPTVLFLDGEGKIVAQAGYMAGGAKAWIAAVEKSLPKRAAPKVE